MNVRLPFVFARFIHKLYKPLCINIVNIHPHAHLHPPTLLFSVSLALSVTHIPYTYILSFPNSRLEFLLYFPCNPQSSPYNINVALVFCSIVAFCIVFHCFAFRLLPLLFIFRRTPSVYAHHIHQIPPSELRRQSKWPLRTNAD